MDSKNKKAIYEIITSSDLSVDDKYNKIIELFPYYLNEVDEKKGIYEKIEWIFHDGLWTYFELLLFDEINNLYWLKLEELDKKTTIEKMNTWIKLYQKFFQKNEYNIDFKQEIQNIEKWSKLSLEVVKEKIWDEKIVKLTHSALDFVNGNARDVYITLESWEEVNFSLKTDKSWKIAISEWQTSKIFKKVYNRYFNLSFEKYENLKYLLFNTKSKDIIFKDFQNIAFLTQKVIINQFWLKNCDINNLKNADFTNITNLEHFIKTLKKYKNGKDNSIVIKIDRLTWMVWIETVLDKINIENLNLNDFSMTDCKPKKWKYWTEPTFKFKWKAFVSLQVKYKRWKNPSYNFWDITIRLRTK